LDEKDLGFFQVEVDRRTDHLLKGAVPEAGNFIFPWFAGRVVLEAKGTRFIAGASGRGPR
jgi:hypothetical protein